MKNKYQFKSPKRKQPLWKIVRAVLSFFLFKKIEVINLAGNIPNKCIFIGNHAGKNGPVAYDKYLPVFHAKWGMYLMLGSYSERFHYLRDVLYIQKYGKSKFTATVKALFEALFSKFIYKGLKIIPSFPDARVAKTFSYSAEVLDNDMAVMVYPEDSNSGYHAEPVKFFSGFVGLSEHYYKKRGEDLPIYPTYLHLENRKLIIGKPMCINELKQQGLSRDEIAEKFRLEVVNLYKNYVE